MNSVKYNTYDSEGRIVSTVESGEKGYCSDSPKSYKETVTYTYDTAGYLLSEVTEMEGGCGGGEKNTYTYTYDSLGRMIKAVYMENDKLEDEFYYEYDELGKEKRCVNKGSDGEVKFEFLYEHSPSGLKNSCTVIYKGEADYEIYNYDYYLLRRK